MSKIMKELDNTAQNLNLVSANLTAVIQSLEKRLAETNLGVSAWYGPPNSRHLVGYGKMKNRWGLQIRETNKSEKPEDWETWPYAEAPRYLRVDCVAWLPELFNLLKQRAAEMADKIERATSKAVDFLRSLESEEEE